MSDSVLTATKQALGLASDYTAFDPELIMHINSVFSTLQQLGLGPDGGFTIADTAATWSEFLGSDASGELNSVRSYMFLKVKMLFDPPATSYAIDAIKTQIQELEWRLNVSRESADWFDPDIGDTSDDNFVEVFESNLQP